MNRRDLVSSLAEQLDTDRRTADAHLQAFVDTVTAEVAKGEAVVISGFVKFSRRDVAAKPRRKGRNPATGEEIWLKAKPASKSAKVLPLKAFKDAVVSGRAPAKKTTAKKTTAKKTTAKKTTAKKTTAKKTTAKKTTTRAVAKKAPARKAAPAKKAVARKAPATRATAKKTTAKKTTRR